MKDGRKGNGLTYRDAGVDIDAGEKLVELVKPIAASTRRPGADADLGGFGGVFDLKVAGYRDPLLVSGTDGVGTKLRVAQEAGKLDTVGIDLVAMCVNDVLAQGAEPLFFLDYYATGKLEPEVAAAVVSGVAEGCRQAACALIGGETAEMPGHYKGDDFDLAGFVVGACERDKLLPHTENLRPGDVLLGLASSGAHSNGYSLIRRICETAATAWDAPFNGGKLADALLAPTRIYVAPVLPLMREGVIKGAAHITGGGLSDNVPRFCPGGLAPSIDYDAWPRPVLFEWLQREGGVAEPDMRRTFNLGIGFVLAVEANQAEAVAERLRRAGETVWRIGELEEAT